MNMVWMVEEENLFHKTLAAGERRLIELMNNSSSKSISGKDVLVNVTNNEIVVALIKD